MDNITDSVKPNKLGKLCRCVVTKERLFPECDIESGSTTSFQSIYQYLRSGDCFGNIITLEVYPTGEMFGMSVELYFVGRNGLDVESYVLQLDEFLNSEDKDFVDAEPSSLRHFLVSEEYTLLDMRLVDEMLVAWFDLNNGVFLTLDSKVQKNLLNHLCTR